MFSLQTASSLVLFPRLTKMIGMYCTCSSRKGVYLCLTLNFFTSDILELFRMLGLFIARSLVDSRIIDINFNPLFIRRILGQGIVQTTSSVELVDKAFAKTLQLLEQFAAEKQDILKSNRSDDEKKRLLEDLTVQDVKLEDLYLVFHLQGQKYDLKVCIQ